MKAIYLACVLFLCAGAAQSQSVYLQYTDPSMDGTAVLGPAQIEMQLWIDFPPGTPAERGGVNVLYDSTRTSLSVIDPVMQTCPGAPPNPCVEIGVDNTSGTISGFIIDGFPFPLQGMHHVANLIFDADEIGNAIFAVEENPMEPFNVPVTFNSVPVLLVLSTCASDSLPQNFHDPDTLTGLPSSWVSIFSNDNADSDNDGVLDAVDNCQLVANPSQCDTDADGYGNHCDADMDNSCLANFGDLDIMKNNFFMQGNSVSDLNCDGVTNIYDLAMMRNQLFQPPGPSGLTNVCGGPQVKSGATGWMTTAGDFCDFNGDLIGDNVTNGLAEAACLEPSLLTDGAALCTSAPLEIAGAVNPILELHANFQPKGTGTFKVTAGTAPPTAAAIAAYTDLFEIDAALGAFQSLPGETLIIPLPAVTPLYVCVVVAGDFAYAQVDHCIACALSCGGPAPTGPSRNPDCGVERF